METQTTTKSHLSIIVFSILFTVMLSACGGGQKQVPIEPSQADANDGSHTETATNKVASNQGKTQQAFENDSFDLENLDQDQDGLIDGIDSDPLTPLTRVRGDNALSIDFVATNVDGYLQQEIIVIGEKISGRLQNSDRYTPPFHLLWHHAEGTFAQEIDVDAEGNFTTLVDELTPTGLSVSAQGVESDSIIVQTFEAKKPILFKQTSPVFTNSYVSFDGIHLDAIKEVWLGDTQLDFTLQSSKLLAQLPAFSSSNVLLWRDDERSYSLRLPLMRRVSIVADDSIEYANDWTALGGNKKLVLTERSNTVVQQATIELPVNNKPTHLQFYHAGYRSLEGTVWPDSEQIILGVKSTLESNVVRRIAPNLPSDQVNTLQSLLQHIMTTEDGLLAVSRLSTIHNNAVSLTNETQLRTETDTIIALLASESEAIRANVVNPFIHPNSRSGQSVFNYFDDTFAAIFATNVMYEPISTVVGLRARYGGNDYAGMSIGMHRDLGTCVGIESLNLPAGIWPSDLCARNEAVYFASVKVTNALTNKVLKSHIKEYLDTSMIGASGWGLISLDQIAFLTSDKGAPLCHMQPCKLEFITGGLGFTTNVSLTKSQLNTHHIVLGRTMLERVVLPILGELLGLASVEGDTGKCLVKHIVTSAPTSLVSYGTMIAEFKKKIDSANSKTEITNTVKETVAKYAYDVATGMLKTQDLPKCLPAAFTNDIFASLREKVQDFAEKAAIPFAVAEKATQVFQGFQAVTAPEKFTFDVAPRAAITRISTSNSNDDIPELFSTVDTNTLYIRGTKFVYLKSNNENYWPKLRLQDRFGNKQTLQLNESHKIDISDLSWVDIGIQVSELKPLMEKLRGELINVSIIMDDQTYAEFSNEGLPLPGRDIRWVGQAKISSVRPQNARSGRLITLRGENLQSFIGRSDLKLTLIQSNDATKTGEIFKVESATATQIKFRLPSELPTNLYKLRLNTSDPNLYLDVPNNVSQSSLAGAISVIPQSASLVQLYDAGAKIDDAFIIYIANSDGDIISQNNTFLSLELLENNRLPAVTMWWKNENLSAQNNGSTTPGNILISCDSGGSDQICTYRVKGEINVDGTFKAINFRGKLNSDDAVSESF